MRTRACGSVRAMARRASRTLSAVVAGRPTARGGGLCLFGGKRVLLAGDRDGVQAGAHGRASGRQVARDVLGVEHPADQMGRARRHPRKGRGQRLAPRRVVAAVEPEFDLRRGFDQRAVAQALHPGGPVGAGHGGLAGVRRRSRGGAGRRGRRRRSGSGAGRAGWAGAGPAARSRPDRPGGRVPRARASAGHGPAAARQGGRPSPRSPPAPHPSAGRRRRARRA